MTALTVFVMQPSMRCCVLIERLSTSAAHLNDSCTINEVYLDSGRSMNGVDHIICDMLFCLETAAS